ncbi:Ribosome biogenesis protein 1 [Lobulomyces angularis]|nr:Ribosome biogenesis protein 1 [Lobulomyces angularis]
MPKRKLLKNEEQMDNEEIEILPEIIESSDDEEDHDNDTENDLTEHGNTSFDENDENDWYYNHKRPDIIPDYNSDTSDEETENTVGNIPLEWYADFDHIGYNVSGNKILKPASKDELDKFVDSMDNPNSWKTVFNELEGKNVVLSKGDLEIMRRIQRNEYPEKDFNPFPNSVEWFSSKLQIHPLSSAPEPKSRFTPSKWEAKKIMKIVRAIRNGWIKSVEEKKEMQKPKQYAIWDDVKDEEKLDKMHIPAPKLKLPGNNESYNPPNEYLPTREEEEQILKDMEEDKLLFVPKKYDSLRRVPGFERFIEDRFDRCLDLYLCPRTIKKKINVDQESLIPKLPDPKDLQPFPYTLSIIYKGHTGKVRSLSVDPNGHWLATGGDDCSVRVWDIATGRSMKEYKFEKNVVNVSWNPSKSLSVLSISVGSQIIILNPGVETDIVNRATNEIFNLESFSGKDIILGSLLNFFLESKKLPEAIWRKPTEKEFNLGFRVIIDFKKAINHFNWHRKGDYFATLTTEASGSSSLIHQLSKYQSQNPFKKSNGLVQRVSFHPSKPILFIATQRYVRVYDMMQQKLVKKLMSGVKLISSMDIHPQGDNLIIGSFDKRLCWFDMDLSSKAYRTLRYHQAAIREVKFHKKYPLFGSCGDDGKLNIFHGMVYNDLMHNPLIVPLKSIFVGKTEDGLGCLCFDFHPSQPWVFSSSGDCEVKLFT